MRTCLFTIVFCTALFAALALCPSARAQDDLTELKLELPPEWPGITPSSYWSDILETADPLTKREPFKAPADTALLSKGKPVTSSDKAPSIGKLEQITDGDKGYEDKSVVEIGKGSQWVQIDLEKKCKIQVVVVWHGYYVPDCYLDTCVMVSDDPEFKTDVKTVFNNDCDNSAKLGVGKDKEYIDTYQGKLVDAKGVEGRYVRCYASGNASGNQRNQYIEVEVYGKPVE